MRELLAELCKVCKVQEYTDLKTSLKEITKSTKYQRELAEKLTKLKSDMCNTTTSEDTRSKAVLRGVWRWIRQIIEDFHMISIE
jgi:hypothetical protein